MEQSGVSQQLSATKTAETYDAHEAFHLFGAAPMSAAASAATAIAQMEATSAEPSSSSGAAPMSAAASAATAIAQMEATSAEPSSSSDYELFPMATSQLEGLEIEQVQALPTKDGPMLIARATAPANEEIAEHHDFVLFPTDDVTKDGPMLIARATAPPDGEVVDDHDFVLFPSGDGGDVVKTLPASVSAVTDTSDYSTSSDASSYSRSNSTPVATYLIPAPLSPSYKVSGNAVDVIGVRSTEDQYFTTPWHVSFGWSRFRSNITTGVGDMVRVFVNGKEMPTKMQLLERGRCVFVTGGLTPPVGDLNFADLSEEHPNHVRFEHYQKSTDTFRYVDSRLYVWGPNESVVVADLDGTLTISDVEGHIRTLRLGQYDFLHKGACDFFTKLHELNLKIIYLTARPIDWATASRTHLENATQHSHSLPPGPLITNSNGLTGALLTEVVNKNPHIFKAQVLNEVQLTLIHAGRVTEHPVFVAGFGNRPTDIVAYENVGMDPSLIFMLDPYSNLKASSDPRIYESYSDPNALLWLLPRLKHRVPIEKVGRIDDYTVRELVLADDRDQLLMAERQARALQEEEYERARTSGAGNVGGSSLTRVLYGSYTS